MKKFLPLALILVVVSGFWFYSSSRSPLRPDQTPGSQTNALQSVNTPASAPKNPTSSMPNPISNSVTTPEDLDQGINIKPAAEAYEAVLPRLVRLGVSNVLGNIGDVWSTANHFLQGKMQVGLEMGMRVMTNSLFGLGGLLDPASEMGLTRRSEDFGQTLGRWGLVSGPYLVLPLLGPSTLRDAAGFLVDRQAATSTLVSGDAAKYSITALELVSVRAELLPATKLLEQVALDKYSFVRDGFLARRRDALFDGAPPLDPADADPGDSTPPPAKPAAAPTARPAAGPASTSKIPAKPAPRTTP